MTTLAAHAVCPTCPACNRPVRSSVQLASAYADLRDLVPNLGHQALEHLLLELEAELTGTHLACCAPPPAWLH